MAITLAPTSRENQKEVKNTDYNIIFLKNSFLNHFQNLKDPRIDRSKDHLLIDIIAISILAVISGADGWTAIETYGKAKEQWLRTFLELPAGNPISRYYKSSFSAIKSFLNLLQVFLVGLI